MLEALEYALKMVDLEVVWMMVVLEVVLMMVVLDTEMIEEAALLVEDLELESWTLLQTS